MKSKIPKHRKGGLRRLRKNLVGRRGRLSAAPVGVQLHIQPPPARALMDPTPASCGCGNDTPCGTAAPAVAPPTLPVLPASAAVGDGHSLSSATACAAVPSSTPAAVPTAVAKPAKVVNRIPDDILQDKELRAAMAVVRTGGWCGVKRESSRAFGLTVCGCGGIARAFCWRPAARQLQL